MLYAALSVLLAAALVWGWRERCGRRKAEAAADWRCRCFKHCRTQYRILLRHYSALTNRHPNQPKN